MRVLIAGGGIGGLTTALALQAHGAEVCVYEQATTLEDIGAGVQISPNAMRVLNALGLYRTLAPLASEPHAATIRHHKSNNIYVTQNLRQRCRLYYGAPYFQFYRPDLIRALSDNIEIKLGSAVRGYAQDKSTATLRLAHGKTAKGDIIIAADGLRSPIRQQMLKDGKPNFSGAVAWRGVVKTDNLPPNLIPYDATIWAGRGKHFVAYYLRGGDLINFVAVQTQKAELQKSFADWCEPVRTLCNAATDISLWELYDRPPAHTICDGRVALLGDAAHPMLPFAAQGASAAIEDAYVLAKCLASAPQNPAQGLLHYQNTRQARTQKIQQQARRAMSLYHANPILKTLAFSLPSLMRRQMDALYGYNPLK